jgi:hypothetical protein
MIFQFRQARQTNGWMISSFDWVLQRFTSFIAGRQPQNRRFLLHLLSPTVGLGVTFGPSASVVGCVHLDLSSK